MGYRLGVDLGTTYTAAAVNVDGRAEMLGLGIRAMQVPSVVFVRRDGEIVVGEAAEQQGAAEPSRVVREFKRRIGDSVPLVVGGAPFSAQALTARLLAWVVGDRDRAAGRPARARVRDASRRTGGRSSATCWARRSSWRACADVETCTEPEAAAITYASRNRVAEGDRVAVYDLGGGTFDAAVLRRDGAGFRLAGPPEGVEHLGGIDFDEAVFRHVLTALGPEVADARRHRIRRPRRRWPGCGGTASRPRRCCRSASTRWSRWRCPGSPPSVRLTRGEFEDMLRPAIGETVAATRRVLELGGGRPRRPGGDRAGRRLVADPAGERDAVGGVRPAAGAGQPPEARRRAGRGHPRHRGRAARGGSTGSPPAQTGPAVAAAAAGRGCRPRPDARRPAVSSTTAGAPCVTARGRTAYTGAAAGAAAGRATGTVAGLAPAHDRRPDDLARRSHRTDGPAAGRGHAGSVAGC